MTTARKLTWDSARKRWKKFYKGKQIYLALARARPTINPTFVR